MFFYFLADICVIDFLFCICNFYFLSWLSFFTFLGFTLLFVISIFSLVFVFCPKVPGLRHLVVLPLGKSHIRNPRLTAKRTIQIQIQNCRIQIHAGGRTVSRRQPVRREARAPSQRWADALTGFDRMARFSGFFGGILVRWSIRLAFLFLQYLAISFIGI